MRRIFNLPCSPILSVTLVLAIAGSTLAGNWPQFRGTNGNGIGSGKTLPAEFGPEKNVAWKTNLPAGVSSPCIWDDRIFVTGYDDKTETLGVFALDRNTGKVLWEVHPKAKNIEKVHQISSPASASPATDGERVYVFFGSIGLICYDVAGKEQWRKEMGPFAYLFEWGAAASPVLDGDSVYQNCDHDGESFLISLDKRTGKVNWKTERPLSTVSYATPVIWNSSKGKRIAVSGSGRVTFYDPETGKELAHVGGFPRIVNTTPVPYEDRLYATGWTRGDSDRTIVQVLMTYRDENKDGKLSKSELSEGMHAKFDKGDADGDGFLNEAEASQAFIPEGNRTAGGSLMTAIKPGGTGDVTDTHVVWRSDRGVPYVPSPLLVNGRMYIVKDGGLASCLDAKTGEYLWEMERLGALGAYYTSPVFGDGKVYFASEGGVVTVISESAGLTKLAQNDMGETVMATPAILDGRIYLRTASALYCFATP